MTTVRTIPADRPTSRMGALLPYRDRLMRVADYLAIGVAVSLPWSTSITGIFAALWAVAVLPTLDLAGVRRVLALPAAAMPLALCLLAVIGMLWADVAWTTRWEDVKAFLRLPAIVLLLVQFRRSERGVWVAGGFLASCSVLLALSWVDWLMQWRIFGSRIAGVPVKNYIVQSVEFLVCIYALGHLAIEAWKRQRRGWCALLVLLAILFFANIVFVATARSTLVMVPVLVLIFGLQHFGWKGLLGMLLAALVLIAAAWASSSYLRQRVLAVITEVRDYRDDKALTSSGMRLIFWTRSIAIASQAPIVGHGTGSVRSLFKQQAQGREGVEAAVTDNPHNEVLLIAIPLGLIGAALLFAIWFSHLLLFRGNDLAARIGVVVVVQDIIGSAFSVPLFEFTLGWLYIFGVGVLGGLSLRTAVSPSTERSHERE